MGAMVRLLLAAVLVAAIHGGILLVDRWSMSQEVVVPRKELQELPMTLGSWSGEAVDLDPRVFIATHADVTVDRAYRDAAGNTVTLHFAAYPDYSVITPHHPDLCYPSAGWTAIDRKDVQLRTDDDLPASAQIITFEQEGRRVRAMFWYQLGNRTAVDYQGVRGAMWKARRRKNAPPLVKVLLQAPATDSAADQKRLCDLAEHAFAWVRKATTATEAASPTE